MTRRIVLATFGSFGDIHPYLGLAIGLAARGHRPVVATSEHYRRKVEDAGIDFHPVRPDIDPTDADVVAKIMDPVHGSEFIVRELAMANVVESHADLRVAAEGADLIVTHPLTFAGRIVAEERGVPWVSAVLAPMSFFSAHDLPVFAAAPSAHAARHLGVGASRSLIRMAKLASRHWADPVRALRSKLGLAEAGDPIFEGQHSPQLVLALFSKVLAEPQPDWPANTVITGNIFHDADETPRPDAELAHFLDNGAPPVVFTLGTSAVGAAGRFYEESAAAVRELGIRGVLLVGNDPRNRPSGAGSRDILVTPYAPYSLLFPRAAAVVHQGGIGTTVQALRAGKPTIVVPFAHDQPDNAYRVEQLGMSRTIYPRRYRGPGVADCLRGLLADADAARKAAEVAERVRAEDGVEAACTAIEGVLARSP